MSIESAAICDIGLVRDNNEDYWEILPELFLYAVADGMGGHNAGEIASKETIRKLAEEIQKGLPNLGNETSLEKEEELVATAFSKANTHVYQLSKSNPNYKGMGTTLCTLLFLPKRVILAHVGDSRVYRYRNRLERLTEDHLLPMTSPKEAPSKGVLTRCIGTTALVEPEITHLSPSPGDLFLLCRDGLTDTLTDREIEKMVKKELPMKNLLEELVNAAKKAGGRDNITIVSVKVTSS